MDELQATRLLHCRLEVLRQASCALGGRPVTVWSLHPAGAPALELTSPAEPPSGRAMLELGATLRQWNVSSRAGRRWVGCHLEPAGPWRIAPVRSEPAAPPPDGVERRSPERITLELAGLCLGMIGRMNGHGSTSPQADAALESGLTALDACLDRVREANGLDLAARGRLLRELANVAESIERAIAALERP